MSIQELVRCDSIVAPKLLPADFATISASNGFMHRSKLYLYSITSSARARSVGGIVRPSALARLGVIPGRRYCAVDGLIIRRKPLGCGYNKIWIGCSMRPDRCGGVRYAASALPCMDHPYWGCRCSRKGALQRVLSNGGDFF